MSRVHFLVPVLLLSLSTSARALAPLSIDEAWEGFSSPDILGSGFTHSLYNLPLEGAAQWEGPKYWSSDYWANKEGGINLRWNSSRKVGFNYGSPSLKELLKKPLRQKAALSPSEKYDILLGRYDYPLKTLVASQVSKKAEDWEGICHGWVVATLHHAEPKPKTLINPDGIEIPFGSSDIKALLSYFYAQDMSPAKFVGLRCNFGDWTGGQRECGEDLNAGAFHIIIANKLALQGQGIIMDVDRFKEVWNQPVVGYRSTMKGPYRPTRGAAWSAKSEYDVKTELWYVAESEPSFAPAHGTEYQIIEKMDLEYRIEVNQYNEIVGGAWISEKRPDFIWQKSRANEFPGLFNQLPILLNDN